MMDVAENLYRSWRTFVRKIHVLSGTYDVPVSLVETHIFVELDHNSTLPAKALAQMLQIDKTTLSRILSKMERKGFLHSLPSHNDKRSRKLNLTDKGKTILKEIDIAGNSLIETLAQSLNSKEREEFHLLLKTFADGLRAAPGTRRSQDHYLRSELRRLARCFGMLGARATVSNLNSTQEYILSTLLENSSEEGIEISKLADYLSIELSTLSHSLAKLENSALIYLKPDRDDARKKRCTITTAGERELLKREKDVAALIQTGLEKLPLKNQKRLLELLQRYAAGDTAATSESQSMRPNLVILTNDRQRNVARNFVVQQLVHEGRQSELMEKVYSSEGYAVAFFDNENILGACEIESIKGKWLLGNFFLSRVVPDLDQYKRILTNACMENFKSNVPGQRVSMHKTPRQIRKITK